MHEHILQRAAYLDTTKVIRGLDMIANPMIETTSKCSINDVTRLSYLLMTKDTIYCDGHVTSDNSSKIDRLLNKIDDKYSEYVSTKIRKKIRQKKFNPEEEISLSDDAIHETFSYYNRSIYKTQNVVHNTSFDNGMSDPLEYLIEPIRKGNISQDFIENLREDKNVVGRRFYASILNNPLLSEQLFLFLRSERMSVKDLPTMFSLFRALFASEKSNKLISDDANLQCIYQPDETRAEILKRFEREHRELSDGFDLGLTQVWLKKVRDEHALFNLHLNQPLVKQLSYEIPTILNLALKASDKEGFFKTVLTFDKSDYYKHYYYAMAEISKAKSQMDEANALAEMEHYLVRKLNLEERDSILHEADTAVFCADISKFLIRESGDWNLEDIGSPQQAIARKAIIPLIKRALKLDHGVRAGIKINKSFGSELIYLGPGERDRKLSDIFN